MHNELEKYKQLNTKYLIPVKHTNPAKVGEVRRLCVLYVIGRFGFSAKVVFEYLLQLPREAINKLFRRLVAEGFINERKSFGSKDGTVYYLSSKGKRFLSYETDMTYSQRTDTSSHNSKTEIHDLSIQVAVIDRMLNSKGKYTAFTTEKELRELGYGTFGELKQERAVDALLYFNDTQSLSDSPQRTAWHCLEMETANSKNMKSATQDLRSVILKKYVNQLSNLNGLYSRVLFYSHRERFLSQIKKRIEGIVSENKDNYSNDEIALVQSELKYINSFCRPLYNIFWNPNFKLEKTTHHSVELALASKLLTQLNENKIHSSDYKNGYLNAYEDLSLLSDNDKNHGGES
jgi:hypothetical protein